MKNELKKLVDELNKIGHEMVKVEPGAKEGQVDVLLSPVIVDQETGEYVVCKALADCGLAARVRMFEQYPENILLLEDVHDPEKRRLNTEKEHSGTGEVMEPVDGELSGDAQDDSTEG